MFLKLWFLDHHYHFTYSYLSHFLLVTEQFVLNIITLGVGLGNEVSSDFFSIYTNKISNDLISFKCPCPLFLIADAHCGSFQ